MRAFENPDDATLGASRPIGSPARGRVTNNSRDHTIAMHGSAGIFSSDKNVGLPGFFRNEEAVACLMNRQRAGNEIGFARQDVPILADPRDFSAAFELAQFFSERDRLVWLEAELARQLD